MLKSGRRYKSIIAILLVLIMSIGLVGCANTKTQGDDNVSKSKYPEKPVSIIVAFAAGSDSDSNVRLVSSYIEKYLNQKIVVLNKPGAGGQIGWGDLAKSEPDGYTIGLLNSPFIQVPIQDPKAQFSIDSFEPIANITTDPGAIYCLPSKNWESIDDIIAEAKANPGKISVACTGLQTSEARTIGLIERQADVKFKVVPFNGAGELNAAILGGHVDFAVQNVAGTLSMVSDNKVRLIAVGSPERSPMCPDVPTMKEQGYNIIQSSMRTLAAPKGMDPEIMKVLKDAIEKGLNDPELTEKAKEMSVPLDPLTGTQVMEIYKELDKNLREEWAVNPWA